MKRASRVVAFWSEDTGAVLAEALIVVPFVTIFAAGILEFGNMFWEKEQVETGLRDAVRFMTRCHDTSAFTGTCNTAGETLPGETIARNIAFYGSPTTTGAPRVPGWEPGSATITITQTGEVIRAETALAYRSSPLFSWLNISPITIEAYHEERYIGW